MIYALSSTHTEVIVLLGTPPVDRCSTLRLTCFQKPGIVLAAQDTQSAAATGVRRCWIAPHLPPTPPRVVFCLAVQGFAKVCIVSDWYQDKNTEAVDTRPEHGVNL